MPTIHTCQCVSLIAVLNHYNNLVYFIVYLFHTLQQFTLPVPGNFTIHFKAIGAGNEEVSFNYTNNEDYEEEPIERYCLPADSVDTEKVS